MSVRHPAVSWVPPFGRGGLLQKVAVVTDSSACLGPALAASNKIEVVPFTLAFGDTVYRDGMGDPEEFYHLLRGAKTPPTTAAPPPAAFAEGIRRAAANAASVLCITLPANLSSAYSACLKAAEAMRQELPETPVRCVASKAVAAGQGLIALEIARAGARGVDLAAAAVLAESLAEQVHFFAFLDSLEYLAKGGHVPKATAWLGGIVGLRLVLTAPNGEVRRITQARSRRAATERLLTLAGQHNPTGKPIQAMIMHASVPTEAQSLLLEMGRRFDCREAHITQFTPVMGAHSGPGVLGIAFRVISDGGA